MEGDVSLRDEHVSVTRTPVGRVIDSDAAFQDQTLTAEEHSEEAMVTKEARVTEEIRLGKEAETHAETVHDTVRRTEVEADDERKFQALRRRDTPALCTRRCRGRSDLACSWGNWRPHGIDYPDGTPVRSSRRPGHLRTGGRHV